MDVPHGPHAPPSVCNLWLQVAASRFQQPLSVGPVHLSVHKIMHVMWKPASLPSSLYETPAPSLCDSWHLTSCRMWGRPLQAKTCPWKVNAAQSPEGPTGLQDDTRQPKGGPQRHRRTGPPRVGSVAGAPRRPCRTVRNKSMDGPKGMLLAL